MAQTVELSKDKMYADVSIAGNPIIEEGKKITVTITGSVDYSNGFRMKCGSNYIAYTINNDGASVVKDTVFLSQNAGATGEASVRLTFVPGVIKYAGTYTDTLTFAVAIVSQTK